MPGGILALDQSSVCTGWAYSDPGDRAPIWGHFLMRRKGETAKDNAGAIGERFGIFLRARIFVLEPKYIVREQPFIGGKRTVIRDGKKVLVDIPINFEVAFALLGLAWQIDTIAAEHGIECHQTTTTPAVKFFTGQGEFADRAAKKLATTQTCRLHGWKCTEDEADAIAILVYAEAKLFPEIRLKMARPAGPLFLTEQSR